MPRLIEFSLICGLAWLGFVIGCNRPKELADDPVPRPVADALSQMQLDVHAGRWNEAKKLADAVLIAHPSNPEAFSLVARVMHETGDRSEAADLLVGACEMESYVDPARVNQSLVALLGVGRLFDDIDLLSKAVSKRPRDPQTRRFLFNLLAGVEDSAAAQSHGEALVRQRHFDVELLLMLGSGSRRKEENRSYQRMVDLNSNDRRPLVGKAQAALDQGNISECIDVARMVLEKHPSHTATRMILGRAAIESNQPSDIVRWIESSTASDQLSPWYWLIVGDWVRRNQRPSEAIGAYWRAIQRDDSLLQAWQKLGSVLDEVLSKTPQDEMLRQTLPIVRARIESLSELRQAKEDFRFSGMNSPARCIRVANTLEQLGRLWEAEAWMSVAMTLPDDGTKVKDLRDRLIGKISRDTPWQLPLPSEKPLDFFASFEISKDLIPMQTAGDEVSDLSHRSGSNKFTAGDEDFVLRDVAASIGINFFGKTSETLGEPGVLLYATAGCGVGVIDYDLDGWPDLYCSNAGGMPPKLDSHPNALFRNCREQFAETTQNSGTGDRGFSQGIAVGDVNEDGFPDLLVASYGPNRLLINNGDGTFSNGSARMPSEASSRWTTSCAIADFNGDGISDFWEVNYCAGLAATHQKCASKEGVPLSSVCAPIAFTAEADHLFFGHGDGTFRDATDDWIVPPSVIGRGLGIVAGEFDQRPGLDVFVTNDMTDNHLWIRDHRSSSGLIETATLRGLAGDGRSQPQGSMGIATGDLDRDGRTDLYVTSFAAEYNTVHLQGSTAGFWKDQTSSFGLAEPTISQVGFGTQAIDFNNDGNLELFVSNGHIDPLLDYAQHAQIFRRTSIDKFLCLPPSQFIGYLASEHVGRAVASLDFNRDGLLDLVVTHQTEPLALLANQTSTGNRWLGLRLVGRSSARDAIGAVAKVTAGESVYSVAKCSGSGYMASNEPVVRVGLGAYAGPITVEIHWPSGADQTCESLSSNQEWMIVEGQEPFGVETVER